MLELIVGCMFPMLLTPDFLMEYKECRDDKYMIENVSEWYPIVSASFNEGDKMLAMKIIYCESSGNSNAIGRNVNGTEDRGLWQFNDKTWAWLKPKLGIISNRFDAEVSTRVAAWLVYNDGWHHWNSSKHCWKGQTNELLWYK